jgi:hypothetical protein
MGHKSIVLSRHVVVSRHVVNDCIHYMSYIIAFVKGFSLHNKNSGPTGGVLST